MLEQQQQQQHIRCSTSSTQKVLDSASSSNNRVGILRKRTMMMKPRKLASSSSSTSPLEMKDAAAAADNKEQVYSPKEKERGVHSLFITTNSLNRKLSKFRVLAFLLLLTILFLQVHKMDSSLPFLLGRTMRSASAADVDVVPSRKMSTSSQDVSINFEAKYGGHARIVSLFDGENASVVTMKTISSSTHNNLRQARRKVADMNSHPDENDSNKWEVDEPEKPMPFETDDCKAMHDWQLKTHMTCNNLHERDLTMVNLPSTTNDEASSNENNDDASESFKLIAHGDWRDVWVIHDDPEHRHVLKTLRMENSFSEDTLFRQRIDALVMERVTSSPFVMDIYGHCAMSDLVEFAPGNDIVATLWPGIEEDEELDGEMVWPNPLNNLTKLELLHIGVQAAMGLAALHNFDEPGVPSVVHNDISPNQFVKVGDRFKLNDFNRARLLTRHVETNETCPYYEDANRGKNRSPEEYAFTAQTAMVDIYSLGNIFYMLLMQNYPWREQRWRRTTELVKEGKRPPVIREVWDSEHPVDLALKKAMIMCQDQDPKDRWTALQVLAFLQDKLEEIDPGRLEAWGVQHNNPVAAVRARN